MGLHPTKQQSSTIATVLERDFEKQVLALNGIQLAALEVVMKYVEPSVGPYFAYLFATDNRMTPKAIRAYRLA